MGVGGCVCVWGGGYLVEAPRSRRWFSVPAWAAGFQFIRSTLPSSERYLRLEQ